VILFGANQPLDVPFGMKQSLEKSNVEAE